MKFYEAVVVPLDLPIVIFRQEGEQSSLTVLKIKEIIRKITPISIIFTPKMML